MNKLLHYRRSRFPLRLFLPLAVLLCTAAYVSAQPMTSGQFVIDLVLAVSLLFQFRLWDDLSDIEKDRIEHPERVLCQTTSLSPFRKLLFINFVLNLVLILSFRSTTPLAVFLILNTVLLFWYSVLGKFRRRNPFNHLGVLAKYPAFVYLLSPADGASTTIPLGFSMLTTYLCFGVYEILHDQRLHAFRLTKFILGVEMALLALVVVLMLYTRVDTLGSRTLMQGLVALGSVGVLVGLYRRHLRHVTPGAWCYSVFVLCFLWSLDYMMIYSEGFVVMNETGTPQ